MRPLAGVRVLDLSRLLPGGFCTMVLADLGAEVIKIEHPDGGDPIRGFLTPGGRSILFDALHRGKRSVALDLRAPEGRDLLLRMAAMSDVVVESFRPGVLDRLGVGHRTLLAANPRLVVCALTGYGQVGALRERAGHDLNYLAEAGVLAFAQPAVDGTPTLPPVQAADLGTGALTAVAAILAALLERHQTGTGRILDIAMAPGLLSWLALPAAEWLEDGTTSTAGRGALHGGLACYGIYPTRDGRWLSVAALEPRFWAALCTRLGRETFIAWQTDPARQAEIRGGLGATFASRTLAEWEAFLEGTDTCVAPVRTLEEALARWPARIQDCIGSDGQPTRIMAGPLGETAPGPAPALGADTDPVLEAIGVTATERARLRAGGIIGPGRAR